MATSAAQRAVRHLILTAAVMCHNLTVMRSQVYRLVTIISLILIAPACRGGGENGEDGSGETGEDPCTGCDGYAFACFANHPVSGWDPEPYYEDCAESENDVDSTCLAVFGSVGGPNDQGFTEWDRAILVCANLVDPDSCANWDPGAHVSINASGVYEVDEGFIDDLIATPAPLIDCDSGRFDFTDPGYELSSAGSGELSDVLGLQNGDVPDEINNLSLDDMADVLSTFVQLYYQSETEFTLEITRGTTPVTINYEIVP